MGVCDLWSEAEPSQNRKRKARVDKTGGGKTVGNCSIIDGWMI